MILREPMNGLTHFAGAVLAVVALVALIVRAAPMPWHVAGFAVFGTGMVLLYTASTLYHWLPLSESGTRLWRRIDHSMIFIYIAASYTPICFVPLRGVWGWSLFGVVWGVALLGLGIKIFWLEAPRWLSTSLYVGMGWVALVAIYPLLQAMPIAALLWLVGGGVLYTIGAVIYALKRPNGRWLGFHEIFHLFVIAGSACHFWLMFHYIAKL